MKMKSRKRKTNRNHEPKTASHDVWLSRQNGASYDCCVNKINGIIFKLCYIHSTLWQSTSAHSNPRNESTNSKKICVSFTDENMPWSHAQRAYRTLITTTTTVFVSSTKHKMFVSFVTKWNPWHQSSIECLWDSTEKKINIFFTFYSFGCHRIAFACVCDQIESTIASLASVLVRKQFIREEKNGIYFEPKSPTLIGSIRAAVLSFVVYKMQQWKCVPQNKVFHFTLRRAKV